MKNILLKMALGLLWIPLTCQGETLETIDRTEYINKNVGLGVIGGQPSGFTFKYWHEERQAFDGGVGYLFGDYATIYADFLHHFLASKPGTASPYIGVGGVAFIPTTNAKVENSIFNLLYDRTSTGGFGIRIPVGVEWVFRSPSLGLFVEAAPGMGIYPTAFGLLEGGAGIRGYF